jgi:hypothetical protein
VLAVKLFSTGHFHHFKGTSAAALSRESRADPHSMETSTQKNDATAFLAQCRHEVSMLRDRVLRLPL